MEQMFSLFFFSCQLPEDANLWVKRGMCTGQWEEELGAASGLAPSREADHAEFRAAPSRIIP